MVHQRITGVVFAGLLFFSWNNLAADGAYPFTPDFSWSAPLYYYIDESIHLCSTAAEEGGDQARLYSQLGRALEDWENFNSRTAPYLYSLLNEESEEAVENSDASGETAQLSDKTSLQVEEIRGAKRDLISQANDALSILAGLREAGADFGAESGTAGKLLEYLLKAMPVLRPDITPSYSFWSTLSGSDDGLDTSSLISAMRSGSTAQLEQLLEDARVSPAQRRVLERRITAGNGFQPLTRDPVRTIYSSGLEESASLLSQDAEYIYYRSLHRDFFQSRLNTAEKWNAYVENLRRSQRNLDAALSPEIPPRQLLARLKIDSENRSDAYWSLLSFLENPIYLDDSDRSAHVEALQLHFLSNYVLSEQEGGTREVELYLPPMASRGMEFSPNMNGMQEQGNARRYMVILHNENSDKAFVRSWAEATLQVSRLNPGDIWHIQTGFYPLQSQKLITDDSSELRYVEMLLRVLETFPDGEDLRGVTDPAAVQLAQFRRIMLYSDLYHFLKGRSDMERLSLKEQNWLHLASDIYAGILDGGDADVSSALTDLSEFLEVDYTAYSFSSVLFSRLFDPEKPEGD